jgi:hypothetical protein
MEPTGSNRRPPACKARGTTRGDARKPLEDTGRLADRRLDASAQDPSKSEGFRALTGRWRPTSRYALGENPGTVMDEMGRTDPAVALRVYR